MRSLCIWMFGNYFGFGKFEWTKRYDAWICVKLTRRTLFFLIKNFGVSPQKRPELFCKITRLRGAFLLSTISKIHFISQNLKLFISYFEKREKFSHLWVNYLPKIFCWILKRKPAKKANVAFSDSFSQKIMKKSYFQIRNISKIFYQILIKSYQIRGFVIFCKVFFFHSVPNICFDFREKY